MSSAPLEDPRPAELRTVPSLLLVNTGNGKGKTTAAIGTVVRAVGHGKKVAVFQFIKSGDWKTGEAKICHQLGVLFESLGDGFTWDSNDIQNDIEMAQLGWDRAAASMNSGEYDLVLFDELTYLLTWGWVDKVSVIEAIRDRPKHVSVIVTGRDASSELIAIADTVSEVGNVKHAYEAGIAAKKGIDF